MSVFKIDSSVSTDELASTSRGRTRDEGFDSLVSTLQEIFESGDTNFQRINAVEQAGRTADSFWSSLRSAAHAMGMNVSRTTRDPEWTDSEGDNPCVLVRFNPNAPRVRSNSGE